MHLTCLHIYLQIDIGINAGEERKEKLSSIHRSSIMTNTLLPDYLACCFEDKERTSPSGDNTQNTKQQGILIEVRT